MQIVYGVKNFDAEMLAAYARLFPEDVEEKSPARLAWRFADAPHGPGFFAVARDADAADQIVGFVGFVGSRVRTPSGTVDSYQAVDLIVDPACRGRGVFAGLGDIALAHAATAGAKMVWGFPNPNAAPGWFGRFTWLNFGTAPFVMKPLRTGYFLRRFSSALGRINLPLAFSRRPGEEPEVVERFDASVDDLWSRFAPQAGVAVVRDSEWLNWRLCDRPQGGYRNVVRRDAQGQIEALVSTVLVEKHGGRILYVMEAMGREPAGKAVSGLLRAEIARAARSGADAVLAWCAPDSPNRKAFRRAGFFPLPDRLRPITINFGAKPLSDDLPEEARRGRSWYLSYVDSDTN